VADGFGRQRADRDGHEQQRGRLLGASSEFGDGGIYEVTQTGSNWVVLPSGPITSSDRAPAGAQRSILHPIGTGMFG
jgi:hypothetical protein